MPTRFTATLRVRSYEMDSFGHVNNAVYLQYLEYARCEYMRQAGLGFADFYKWNAIPYVVHAELDFKSSARVDDELEIHGQTVHWGRSSFVLDYEVYNKTSGKISAVASTKFAFVNRDEKIIPVPPEFRRALE